jgi:hypothetical protein
MAGVLLAGCGAPVVGGTGDAGMDVVACGDGQAVCNNRCANVQTDPNNCGACGTTCAAGQACTAGRCEIVCPSGQTLCNGACVSIQADRANCGACGMACPAGQVCSMGACATTCGAGLTDCMGSCRDTQTDRGNCGACGTSCPSGQVCVMGACATSCPMGQTECGGVCVNTQTDRGNCGMCGTACAAGQICTAGVCELSCATGQTACGMPAACTDTQSDRANCGMCGNACGDGLVCSMGMCVPSCAAGQTNCMGSCVSTVTNPNHCGACGTVCGPYANAIPSCNLSMCIMTCNRGFNDCNSDRMDGCEIETNADVNNCGRCGNVCSFPNAVPACMTGACRIASCNPGFENADGIAENGCETRTVTVGGMSGAPFSDGTLRNVVVDPMMGGIVPSGSVTTTTNDFLWVVNTAESTVSKWDAQMNREVARYRVGLAGGECAGRCCWENGCNMPSRVVIDGNGDAYIASRAFAMQGTVTKIAGDRADCVDRNGNGMIETSTSATPLAYSAGATGVSSDECVLWTANVGAPNALLRAIAIDRGDASRPNGYVWVGGYLDRTAYRLDPLDGRTLNTQAGMGINPYGAVVTRDGRVWFTSGNLLQAVDSTTVVTGMPVTLQAVITMPFNFYGPAADATGRLWFSTAGATQVWGFDPTTMRTTRADLAGGTSLGATVDSAGNFVVSIQRAGRTDIARFPVSAFTPGASLGAPGVIPAAQITYIDGLANPTSAFPSAVGVDRRNDIWVAAYTGNNRLMKFETAMGGMVREFTGTAAPNRTYSYSDFTGSVRRTSIPQGSYEQTFDLSCANPRPSTLRIDGNFPMGTIATVSVRTAATVAALGAATPVPIATLPPSASPYDLASAFAAARITPAQQLRVTMVLRAAESGAVPLVRGFDIRWTCP